MAWKSVNLLTKIEEHGKDVREQYELSQQKTIEDIDVNGKKVLVRCDFNVPLADASSPTTSASSPSSPTIRYLVDHGRR